MNTLFEKFAAYEISTEQTSQVRGGTYYTCTVSFQDGTSVSGTVDAEDSRTASNLVQDAYIVQESEIAKATGSSRRVFSVSCA